MKPPPPLFKATLEPDGLGVGWSNPILVDQMGRSGEVVSLEVRGDPADATTGTATLMLFEAPIPKNPADYIDAPGIVDVAKLDPATIPDGDQALRIVDHCALGYGLLGQGQRPRPNDRGCSLRGERSQQCLVPRHLGRYGQGQRSYSRTGAMTWPPLKSQHRPAVAEEASWQP
jgi:hypothetical protein